MLIGRRGLLTYVIADSLHSGHIRLSVYPPPVSPFGCTAAVAPPPFRPSDPALCGSRPLVTPYYCRLGDLLCLFYVYPFVCTLLSMYMWFSCFRCFLCFFVASPSVLWYCWLGLLTCKNRLPCNLYCVGGYVKHCSLTHSPVSPSILSSYFTKLTKQEAKVSLTTRAMRLAVSAWTVAYSFCL